MEEKNTAQPLFRQLPAMGPLALTGTSAHGSPRHLPAATHPSPWVHPKVPSWCAWLTSCSRTDLGVLASRHPSLLPQPRPEALSLSPNPCALCPENPCCLSRLSSLLLHAAAVPPSWLPSGPQASLAPHPVKPSQSPPCCHQGTHTQGICASTWHQRRAGCPGGLSKAAGSWVTQSLGSYRAG